MTQRNIIFSSECLQNKARVQMCKRLLYQVILYMYMYVKTIKECSFNYKMYTRPLVVKENSEGSVQVRNHCSNVHGNFLGNLQELAIQDSKENQRIMTSTLYNSMNFAIQQHIQKFLLSTALVILSSR